MIETTRKVYKTDAQEVLIRKASQQPKCEANAVTMPEKDQRPKTPSLRCFKFQIASIVKMGEHDSSGTARPQKSFLRSVPDSWVSTYFVRGSDCYQM